MVVPTTHIIALVIYILMFFVTWIINQVMFERSRGSYCDHPFAFGASDENLRWFMFLIWPVAWTIMIFKNGITGINSCVNGISKFIATRL